MDNLLQLQRPSGADSTHLPDDFATLRTYQLRTAEQLAVFATTLEHSWAEAERNGAEIARLLELQSAILAKVAGCAATDAHDVLRKLRLWQLEAQTGENDGVGEDIIHSVIEDVQRICRREAHAELT